MKSRIVLLSICLGLVLGITAVSSSPTTARQEAESFVYLPIVINGLAQGDNANEWAPPYTGQFQYGLNPGYYGNGWTDHAIYQLCYDAGCRSARNSLP
ncbi:MAG: hypothetical protein R6X34_06880, partial [Chloroflexota bacterium]